MKILSIDLGHDTNKIIYRNTEEEKGDSEIQHGIDFEKVDSTIIELDCKVKDENAVEYEGKWYLMGGGARVSKYPCKRILNYDNFEELKEASGVILAKYLKLHEKNVDYLVISLFPTYFNHVNEYQDYLRSKFPEIANTISVIPQVVGSKVYIENTSLSIDKNGKKINNYLLLDCGYSNINVGYVEDGRLALSDISTHLGAGTTKVVAEVMGEIANKYSILIPARKVISCVRSKELVYHGEVYDLTSIVNKSLNGYSKFIQDLISSDYKEKLNKLNHVIVVGGFAELARNKIPLNFTSYAPSKKYTYFPTNDSEFFNALGGAYFL